MTKFPIILVALIVSVSVSAQSNHVDVIRHDAPELAHFGPLDIGVRTLTFTNPQQADIVASIREGTAIYKDRQITVEIWYPAQLRTDQAPSGQYTSTTRNLKIIATLNGSAVRDAKPRLDLPAAPLVIISHGYPGNRYLMSHLGENLASKGYIVAAIDHPGSTYEDQVDSAASMYHRPIDQLFVIDQLAALSDQANHDFNGRIDTQNSAIIGYSVGGTGLLINMGGGYSDAIAASLPALPKDLARRHAASNPNFKDSRDPRIKAAVAIAPWGMANGVWNAEDLRSIDVATLYMSGSIDETSGYELGTRALFEAATNSNRYLLTFLNAGHNAIAPIPLPVEFENSADKSGASHYTDPVWDSVRSSNVMMHFVTAFFDLHLNGNTDCKQYLELVENSEDGVYSVSDESENAEHSYWAGFPRYTARGLILEHRTASD